MAATLYNYQGLVVARDLLQFIFLAQLISIAALVVRAFDVTHATIETNHHQDIIEFRSYMCEVGVMEIPQMTELESNINIHAIMFSIHK